MKRKSKIIIHKKNKPKIKPKVSIILLDWSVRESFHSLDFLLDQTVPRESYELVWVELYNRVIPQVKDKVDVLITCNQRGIYHYALYSI